MLSLLIHAFLLVGVIGLAPLHVGAPGMAIQAVVSGHLRGIVGQPAAVQPESSAMRPDKPTTTAVDHASVSRISVAESASPAATVSSAAPDVASPSSGYSPARGGAVVAGTAVSSGREAREGVNADDIGQYRMSVAAAAKRFKRYPPLARERGWEGVVEVGVIVRARTVVPEIVLVRSSGRALLDEQALETISQAARVSVLPEGLRGKDFRENFPIKFSLEDAQ